MAKSKKRRVTRVGPKHRMWITIEKDTFVELQASGEKLGYSISALVQRVVVRGIAAGLIDDPSPTLNEQYYQLTEELCRSQKDHIEILQDRIDLKEQMIAHMQRGLEEQGAEILAYERASLEAAGPTVAGHADDAERLDG